MMIKIPSIIFDELFDEEPQVIFGLAGIMLMVHSFVVSGIVILITLYVRA